MEALVARRLAARPQDSPATTATGSSAASPATTATSSSAASARAPTARVEGRVADVAQSASPGQLPPAATGRPIADPARSASAAPAGSAPHDSRTEDSSAGAAASAPPAAPPPNKAPPAPPGQRTTPASGPPLGSSEPSRASLEHAPPSKNLPAAPLVSSAVSRSAKAPPGAPLPPPRALPAAPSAALPPPPSKEPPPTPPRQTGGFAAAHTEPSTVSAPGNDGAGKVTIAAGSDSDLSDGDLPPSLPPSAVSSPKAGIAAGQAGFDAGSVASATAAVRADQASTDLHSPKEGRASVEEITASESAAAAVSVDPALAAETSRARGGEESWDSGSEAEAADVGAGRTAGFQHPLEALAAGGQRPKDLMGLSTLLDDRLRDGPGEAKADASDSDWDDVSSASGAAAAPAAGVVGGTARRTVPSSPPSMQTEGVAAAAAATPSSDWDAESPAMAKALVSRVLPAEEMSDEEGCVFVFSIPCFDDPSPDHVCGRASTCQLAQSEHSQCEEHTCTCSHGTSPERALWQYAVAMRSCCVNAVMEPNNIESSPQCVLVPQVMEGGCLRRCRPGQARAPARRQQQRRRSRWRRPSPCRIGKCRSSGSAEALRIWAADCGGGSRRACWCALPPPDLILTHPSRRFCESYSPTPYDPALVCSVSTS